LRYDIRVKELCRSVTNPAGKRRRIVAISAPELGDARPDPGFIAPHSERVDAVVSE